MSLSEIYRNLIGSYRASIKRGMDAEFVLYRLYRPLSFPLSAGLIKLGVSANQATLLSLVALLVAIALFVTGDARYMTLGAFMYALAFILDFADGNIARFHNKPNYFGKLIDGLVDTLTCVLFIAVALGNTRAGRNLLPADAELAVGVATALVIVLIHYYRMRVAYFIKESGVGDSPSRQTPEREPGVVGMALNLANKSYKNLGTSTPIALLIMTPLDLLSLFVGFFFALHTLMGFSEIEVSLFRLRRKLNVYRAY